MKKNFFFLLLFFAFFTSSGQICAVEPDDEDVDVFSGPVWQVSLSDFTQRDILGGLRQLRITTSSVRNVTSPWTNNLYAQLTNFLHRGNVLYVAGEAYPLVLRLAADSGERIVFYLDEMLPQGEQEAVFYLGESLQSHVGVSSLLYPYSPIKKDDGPPLKEVGNATVLVSADIRVSDTEVRKFPVAICFHYGNGRVFYSSFQIENRAKSREARGLAAAFAVLTQTASGERR